jgi:hypothetical protein
MGPIFSYCQRNGLPTLTDLVVSDDQRSEKFGMPFNDYTAPQDLPRALAEVFAYDWLGHGCPKVAEFEDALAAG